jgi:hypothetical protein
MLDDAIGPDPHGLTDYDSLEKGSFVEFFRLYVSQMWAKLQTSERPHPCCLSCISRKGWNPEERCDGGLLQMHRRPFMTAATIGRSNMVLANSASPVRLGQFLRIAQITPLAVSSSTPWRIYA